MSEIRNAGVHHIALSASDFDKSHKFYTEALGFSQIAMWGEGSGRAALLDTGNGVYLELYANGSGDAQENAKFVHIALSTGNPDTLFKSAVAAGASPHMEPADRTIPSNPPMPVRIAFVKGFDGELLEFFQMR